MIRGTHRLKRVNFKSPVVAIISNKKVGIHEDKSPKTRMRKKRFGIFTKKVEV